VKLTEGDAEGNIGIAYTADFYGERFSPCFRRREDRGPRGYPSL
jgi:hypothetical protein